MSIFFRLLTLSVIMTLCACSADRPASQTEEQSTLNNDTNINGAVIDAQINTEPDTKASQEPIVEDDSTDTAASTTQANIDLEPVKAISEADIVASFEFSGGSDTRQIENSNDDNKRYCIKPNNAEQSQNNAEQSKSACQKISGRLASVSSATCLAAKLKSSNCSSVSGFPILYSEFPPLVNKPAQARILVIGGMHGDELTSTSISFKWIEKLNKFHSGLFHWHIIPLMNPDGLLKAKASRTNQNGVDLNRNLPSDDWQQNALKYWENKKNKDPRRFPGNQAASEPETQWLIDEINNFKPDAIISIHAPYGVVDFDALSLNSAPKSLGKLHLNLLGTYPGSLGNYAGINRNIPVITLELPHSWVMPSDDEISKIWLDIVSWLRNNIQSK